MRKNVIVLVIGRFAATIFKVGMPKRYTINDFDMQNVEVPLDKGQVNARSSHANDMYASGSWSRHASSGSSKRWGVAERSPAAGARAAPPVDTR